MNTNSKKLAGLVGPVLLAICASEAINMDIYVDQSAPVVYLNGVLLFIAGLALVRAHKHWALDWSVLVTLVAWTALAVGLYRMFIPTAPQADVHLATYLMLAGIFAVGAILCWAAYLRRD